MLWLLCRNLQHDHSQTEELVKYVREIIQLDEMVTIQRTRNIQMRLRLMIKMKLQ